MPQTDTKHCRRCDERKPLSEFYPRRLTRGVQPYCKACVSTSSRETYLRKRAEIRARHSQWEKANRDKRRVTAKRAREKNPDGYRAQVRAWRESHKEHDAFRSRTRKAVQRRAVPAWASVFFMQEAYRLARSRSIATGFEWHVDHVVPIKSPIVCGLHWEGNFQLLPGALNHSKGNRWWPDMP